MEVDVQSILFQHPCNIFIIGPSGCGKTEFVQKLIDKALKTFKVKKLFKLKKFKVKNFKVKKLFKLKNL